MRRKVGPIVQRIVREGDRIYNVWDQPDRQRILEENARLRSSGSARNKSWIGPGLRIPIEDREVLKQRNPELFCKDGKTQRKAIDRFMNSSESDPYRVTERRRRRG